MKIELIKFGQYWTAGLCTHNDMDWQRAEFLLITGAHLIN